MNRALLWVAGAALLVTGCVEYSEQWRFDVNGAGRVYIMCQPSQRWRAAHTRDEWDQAAKLFMPMHHAISQACAQAGVRIERCRFDYDAQRALPCLELVLAFDAVPQIARCSLFAGRELQWRRTRNVITFLHTVHAYPAHITPPRDGLMHPEWFADGTVMITTIMPGAIVRAEGATGSRRAVTATATLNDIARGRALIMLTEARIPRPWWWWRLAVRVALAVSAVSAVSAVILKCRRPAWRVE